MEFDDILESIGEYGRYQKWLLFFVCLAGVPNGFILLDSVFLLGVPEHRCAIPGYDNDTYVIQDANHRDLVDILIPPSPDEEGLYDQCHIDKVRDSTETTDQLQENATMLKKCSKWVYDTTIFKETYVTKTDLVCDNDILVANAGMAIYLGMLIGSLVGGIISDRFGRKLTFMAGIILRSVSPLISCWSTHYLMFAAMQFVKGAAFTVNYLAGYVLVMEMIGKNRRVFSGMVQFLTYTFGTIILGCLAYGLKHWFWIQLVLAAPNFLLISYWWFLQESPRWLLMNDRKAEAEVILAKVAKWNGTYIDKSLIDEKLVIQNTDDNKKGILVIFTNRALLIRSLLVCFNWMICAFIYFGLAMNSGKIGGDVYVNFLLLAVVEIPAHLAAALIGDRMGRRKALSMCMLVAGVSCLSTLLTEQYATHVPYLTIILASIGKLCVTICFNVIYVYSVELFPTVIRNAALGIASLSARVGALIAPYLVVIGNAIGGPFGQLFPLIVFGCTAILSACLVLLLPETLNKNLPDSVDDDEPESTITIS